MALIFPLWKTVFHLHCILLDGGVKGICIDKLMGRQGKLCHNHRVIQDLTPMYISLQLTVVSEHLL